MLHLGIDSNNSQLTHFQKYKDEYQGFLSKLNDDESVEDVIWLNGILSEEVPKDEDLSAFFQKMVKLHASELRRVMTTGEESLSPLDMKRIERLDRLTGYTSSELGQAIHSYILEKGCLVPSEDLLKNTHSSCNSTFFLLPQQWGFKVGLYKPSTSTKAPFPGVNNKYAPLKQVGAYLISRINGGRSDVPLSITGQDGTTSGSFQTFRKSTGDLTAIDFSIRSEIPADTMHFATIFRGRLYDLDAHDENILLKKKGEEYRLTHIDLDYTLPNFLCEASRDIRMKVSWVFFPQLDEPFSEEVLGYLSELDAHSEIEQLDWMLGSESRELLEATTYVFKNGAACGLTPGAILDFLDSTEFRHPFIDMLELANKCDSEERHHVMEWLAGIEVDGWQADALVDILNGVENLEGENAINLICSDLKGVYTGDIYENETLEIHKMFSTIASLLVENPEIREGLKEALRNEGQIGTFIQEEVGPALRAFIKSKCYAQSLDEGLSSLKIEFDEKKSSVDSLVRRMQESPNDPHILKELEESFENLLPSGVVGRRFAVLLAREALQVGIPDETIREMVTQLRYHSANTVASEIYSVQAIQEALKFAGKDEWVADLETWYKD